jgi:hypothetical protein
MVYTYIKEKHKMFKKLKELLQRVMQSKNETSLERFINSKHPQNAAEIEHWVRQYSQNVYGGHYGR